LVCEAVQRIVYQHCWKRRGTMVEYTAATEKHPARKISLLSREYVHTHNKAGWLGMYAENGIIEDPIGASPLDPAGKGHKTPAEREAFWDNNIANSDIKITIHESYAAGNEVANHVTLDMVMPMGGKKFSQQVKGVFTYKVNDQGKLLALRGYWELEEAVKTIREVPG
jgi:steroid Delta-isomerase